MVSVLWPFLTVPWVDLRCVIVVFSDHDALAVVRLTGVYLLEFFCSSIQFYLLLSPYLCFITFLYLDLYVLGDDALIS